MIQDWSDPERVYDELMKEVDPGMHHEGETERFYDRLSRCSNPPLWQVKVSEGYKAVTAFNPISVQGYAQLSPCVDHHGHHFTIPAMSAKAVCSRCGLIREQPKHDSTSTV
jgi:hypothetical protein